MPVLGYLETLERFGLHELKTGVDLQLENGDIAITRDGDFKVGTTRVNALFRLVERWRLNESAIEGLFINAGAYAERFGQVMRDRERGLGSTLSMDPSAFHDTTEAIGESESGAAVYAGAILVVVNNLLQRFKLDLGATTAQWNGATPRFYGHSFGEVVAAAAANFRHHDEWASSVKPNKQQMGSMVILAPFLNSSGVGSQIFPIIRSNVCREVLQLLSDGSAVVFNDLIFDFAKNLAYFDG